MPACVLYSLCYCSKRERVASKSMHVPVVRVIYTSRLYLCIHTSRLYLCMHTSRLYLCVHAYITTVFMHAYITTVFMHAYITTVFVHAYIMTVSMHAGACVGKRMFSAHKDAFIYVFMPHTQRIYADI